MSADMETTTPTETTSRGAWCTKMVGYFRCNRNRISPGLLELPDCDFFNVAPRRTLRVLRPALKSGRFYEPQSAAERPESINDNFYSRWARRPHPSGNCRCSFRQSANSSRLSSHEEKIISQEIERIRTSLCEAEKSGKDIQELEKSLAIDLTQLQSTLDEDQIDDGTSAAECSTKIKEEQRNREKRLEPLGEQVKKRIVKDLDRYISDLLDEILNDTIKAIAQADNPFSRERREQTDARKELGSFDISFAFHGNNDGDKVTGDESKDATDTSAGRKGYVNQGFVGSISDPDALDFHLRHRLNGDVILENVDCIDSGINSVETIELQPEQEQNLEQSLMDIIDAKLGGASIGRSLENLGMEIDSTDNTKIPETSAAAAAVAEESEVTEAPPKEVIPETKERTGAAEAKKSTTEEKRVTINEAPVKNAAAQRDSKSLDDVTEEPAFNSLRLEFKRGSGASKESEGKPAAANVTSRVNKTVSVIRQRIATRLGNNRRKAEQTSSKSSKSSGSNNSSGSGSSGSASKTSTRTSLELEDYRRRFPVPDNHRHRHQFRAVDIHALDGTADEVTLRNRHRKPMIVFLHGFGSSAESFGHQLRYFANLGYPCIAPDLLGHGMSSAPSGPRDYQFGRLLKDLEMVLLHYAFKPGQKCVLVAHNYGCSFATALASKYTSNVHQLVLISGGGPTALAPPASEGAGHCCLRASLAPLLVCGMNRAVLYSARGRQHPYCGSEELQQQWPSHMRHVLRGMAWPDGDYVFHRRICTPTLLVHGLRDSKVSLVQECQMERTMIKAFLEAIPAAGHMPMTDCPEQLNHMIHCFIDLWKNKKW